MFTNRIVAAVALLFAAAVLAHPGPAIAQSKVDKAMNVLPSPGAGKGTIIVNGKQMSFDEAKKIGIDPSDAEAKGIVIINNKPVPLSDAAAKGIIVVDSKPGGMGKGLSPGAAKGIILQSPSPAAAQGMVLPGAKVGFNPQPEPPGLGAHGAPAMKNIKALQ